MFIVKKNINGKDYYYLRESKRENGKVKAVNIAYLGKTQRDAEQKMRAFLKRKEKPKPIQKQILRQKQKRGKEKKEIGIDELAKFCKRKGFVYSSADIYGGFSGFWDFGHIGVELKNNIKKEWWKFHVQQRDDIVGVDGSIITHPKVWKASGHVDSFSDVLVVCKKCKKPNKFDKFELDKAVCQFCGGEVDKKNAKDLGMMMETQVGPDPSTNVLSYLRPETAQLIFTNFKFVQENARMKLPFGIAQIGKAFRNEIAPRDFLFRLREFEQMEIEYFINPENRKCPYEIPNLSILIYSAEMQNKKEKPVKMKFKQAFNKKIIKEKWQAYWLATEYLWFISLGANAEKFRIRQHLADEKSHYAIDTWDLEYKFPFGWKELLGIADRSDFDLRQHEKFSGKDLKIFDEKTKKKVLAHVIAEPSLGVERAFLVFMFDAYKYDERRQNIVLHLNPWLAPIKAAVFPIVNKPNLIKIAEDIFKELKKEFNVVYDSGGSIGRRYARNDEAGTQMCITIDEKSIKGKDVTIRNRDNTRQVRVKISKLKEVIRKVVEGEDLLKLGREVKTRIK